MPRILSVYTIFFFTSLDVQPGIKMRTSLASRAKKTASTSPFNPDLLLRREEIAVFLVDEMSSSSASPDLLSASTLVFFRFKSRWIRERPYTSPTTASDRLRGCLNLRYAAIAVMTDGEMAIGGIILNQPSSLQLERKRVGGETFDCINGICGF